MNNDTTQHDTTANTTHHYMGTYTLGHHLFVAKDAYVESAKAMLGIGDEYHRHLAEVLLGQAENASQWSHALQAGSIVESLDDLVHVRVEAEDVWVRPAEIASLWAVARGETLPEPPSHVGTSGHSPDNVSRETLEEALPPAPAPVGYIGLMETTTPTTATASDLVAQLVTLIVTQVMAQVTDEVEAIAETVAENVYDSKDIASEVTESYDFSSAVEDVISGHDFSDIVRDAVRELSFSVTVD